MACINHWIARASFPTRLYHPALAGTPPEEGNWNYLGGLFPTPLYHGSAELAECPASMQAGLRRNDGEGWVLVCAGMTGLFLDCQSFCFSAIFFMATPASSATDQPQPLSLPL